MNCLIKKIIYAFWIICLLLSAACAIRQGTYTMLSTRNVTLDKVDIDSLPQKKDVEGEASRFVFLFIPFGYPHLADAVDDALSKGNGDLMTDVAIYTKSWWFLIGQNTIIVKGSVVNTRGVK
jgi:hypothetical protein